jgi:hypothetical protein
MSTPEPTVQLPSSGHWVGDPSMTLDINGNTLSLEMTVQSGIFTCTLTGTVYLGGMAFSISSDGDANHISGTFSDPTHVSGTYTIGYCGYMSITPVSGEWSAHLEGADGESVGGADLTGSWSGKAMNGDTEIEVFIAMLPDCKVGEVCGWFNLPIFSCAGIFRLLDNEGGSYHFEAVGKTDACGTGEDYLNILDDGTLEYVSVGDYGEDKGILYRAGGYADLKAMAGDWSGMTHGITPEGETYSLQEHYTIYDSCALGNDCASFYYSDYECSGEIQFDSLWYDVVEGHSFNTSGCSGGSGIDYYQPQSDGSLLHFSKGDWGADLTILYRN